MVQMVIGHTNTYMFVRMYVVLLAHTGTCTYTFLFALELTTLYGMSALA